MIIRWGNMKKEETVKTEFVNKLNSLWGKIRKDLENKNISVITETFGDPMLGSYVDEKIGTVHKSNGILKLIFTIDGRKSGLHFTPYRVSRRPIDPDRLYDIISDVFKDNGINISNIDTTGWSTTLDYYINYVLDTDKGIVNIIWDINEIKENKEGEIWDIRALEICVW